MNAAFGMTLNEYTIRSEAAGIDNTSFLFRAANEPFSVRDGRLITGRQQYSSALTAELALEAFNGKRSAELEAGGAARGQERHSVLQYRAPRL
ncbi:MAG TPA: hypothetical protein VLA00_04415 [Xanthobacteraceae bacterium]|nr:hypothetical protein [Xanthobacteraceae bacterium]